MLAGLACVDQLHGQTGGTPLGDEAPEQRRLALVDEIDHAARGPHLEIVQLLAEPIGQPPPRKAELHLDAGLAGMQPLESRIAPEAPQAGASPSIRRTRKPFSARK